MCWRQVNTRERERYGQRLVHCQILLSTNPRVNCSNWPPQIQIAQKDHPMSSEITEVCTVQLNFAQDGALPCKFITLPKQYICIYIVCVWSSPLPNPCEQIDIQRSLQSQQDIQTAKSDEGLSQQSCTWEAEIPFSGSYFVVQYSNKHLLLFSIHQRVL